MPRIGKPWGVPAIVSVLAAAALTIGVAIVGWASTGGGGRVEGGARGGKGSRKGSASEKVVFVKAGAEMKYLANAEGPGPGPEWTSVAFDDAAWRAGTYPVGDPDSGEPKLVKTKVSKGSPSIYTRARFTIPDATAIHNLFLGGRYKDGYAVWLNGTEVFRSPALPKGALDGST